MVTVVGIPESDVNGDADANGSIPSVGSQTQVTAQLWFISGNAMVLTRSFVVYK